jgi:hypothetical protein
MCRSQREILAPNASGRAGIENSMYDGPEEQPLMRRRLTTCKVIGFTLAITALPSAYGDNHEQMQMPASPKALPPITITINPEARLSVALTGRLPRPAPCGAAVDFRVKIINQGFITSRLEATVVNAPREGVALDFHPEPLKGIPNEFRHLRIILTKPGPTDLTISFRSHNNAPDLGGRDRVHFLMQCS